MLTRVNSRNYYCTFGGAAYDATLQRISADAKRLGGVADVWIYDEPWLMQQPFYRENQWAWQHPGHNGSKFGFGWYIWKSHVVRHAMERLEPGDVLLYTDADTYPIADFRMLFHACRTATTAGGIFCFEATGCSNRQWVKRDVWEAVFPRRLTWLTRSTRRRGSCCSRSHSQVSPAPATSSPTGNGSAASLASPRATPASGPSFPASRRTAVISRYFLCCA